VRTVRASSRAGKVAALLALSTALSGCYYYSPYGYMPYGDAGMQEQPDYGFTMPESLTDGTATSNTTVTTGSYAAAAKRVFVAPGYYTPTYYSPVYPYYGWPVWSQPSVSLSFGYWRGCCYGGGRHGYWGGHGHRGYGHRGGWGGHGGWSGRGHGGGGMGGHHWGGSRSGRAR
jgi:hypothetical protein